MSTLWAAFEGDTPKKNNVLTFPQLTPTPIPTHLILLRIKKQFPHTRTANARKTCDTRHTQKKNGEPNTNKKKEKQKKWEKRKWTKKARKLATKDANDLFNRFDHEHMYV